MYFDLLFAFRRYSQSSTVHRLENTSYSVLLFDNNILNRASTVSHSFGRMESIFESSQVSIRSSITGNKRFPVRKIGEEGRAFLNWSKRGTDPGGQIVERERALSFVPLPFVRSREKWLRRMIRCTHTRMKKEGRGTRDKSLARVSSKRPIASRRLATRCFSRVFTVKKDRVFSYLFFFFPLFILRPTTTQRKSSRSRSFYATS